MPTNCTLKNLHIIEWNNQKSIENTKKEDHDHNHQDQDHHHKVNNHHVKESIKNKNIIEEKDIAKILKEIKDNEKTTSINIIKKKINKNIQKIKKNMKSMTKLKKNTKLNTFNRKIFRKSILVVNKETMNET